MLKYRQIIPRDNKAIASIIRKSLEEFGANKQGTVYYDESTDHLFELFDNDRSHYIVVEDEGQILGGGGIYPSPALPSDTVELVKMYLCPEGRGKGIGLELLRLNIEEAQKKGYQKMYLETMPELTKAISLYEKMGFEYIDQAMGNTGHTGCGVWMIKDINTK